MKKGVYKNAKEYVCKYCNQHFYGRRKLEAHYKECAEKLKLPHDSLGRVISFDGHKKAGATLRTLYESGLLKASKQNWSSESRAHMAEIMREKHKLGNFCNYNEKACKYMDLLNEENGWNLQHALNGGEVQIGPYFLDGYDKNLNIAFEYDEPKHNRKKAIIRDKERANYIIKRLHCRFFRYNEARNELYEYRPVPELE